ncbi:MAG: hypothetical protein ACQCN4_00060 [Candidatus Bathyarchaeia archaeon]|jgi:hypothetical protein
MQNINPLFFLQPIIVIAFSFALMLYWYKKRHFHVNIWLYTLIAYGGAIALKYAIQIPTIGAVAGLENPFVLGAYYGLQTVFLEVGLAYVIAYFAFKRGGLERKDAEAYGSELAFWENAVMLSGLGLVNLAATYFVLSGSGSLAEYTYNQLMTSSPGLFAPNLEALAGVGIGVFERFSSALIHIAWGYLCVMAVLYRNKKLFLIALPMGLVDFLIPFASANMMLFEVVVFALAALSVFVAWYAAKKAAPQVAANSPPAPPEAATFPP